MSLSSSLTYTWTRTPTDVYYRKCLYYTVRVHMYILFTCVVCCTDMYGSARLREEMTWQMGEQKTDGSFKAEKTCQTRKDLISERWEEVGNHNVMTTWRKRQLTWQIGVWGDGQHYFRPDTCEIGGQVVPRQKGRKPVNVVIALRGADR